MRGSSISRYAKGVYRIDVVSSMLEEEVLVAWTSIDPRRCPGDITGEDMSVATGRQRHGSTASASSASPIESCSPESKQAKFPNPIINKRHPEPKDETYVSGIPVTRAWLRAVDLMDPREDRA